jgi:hypothetical protein
LVAGVGAHPLAGEARALAGLNAGASVAYLTLAATRHATGRKA